MRYLKNRIDEFKQTNVIDVVLTVHPISNPREWVSKPLRPNGEVDEVKARGFLDKDRSEGFRVVIKPGETVAFGEGSEFNEEQAEYIYRTFISDHAIGGHQTKSEVCPGLKSLIGFVALFAEEFERRGSVGRCIVTRFMRPRFERKISELAET